MKTTRSVLVLGLACCLAATSGFARQTSSHSKSARAEKSSRSSSGKSHTARKTKARKEEARASRGSESERFLRGEAPDLPPEDLPEADDGDSQPQ